MSITLQWKLYANSGTALSPTSVKLQDKDGIYGVRRTDTGAVVVASGTAMTHTGGGVYTYTFDEPDDGLTYEYSVRVAETIGGGSNTYYVEQTKTATPAWGDLTTLAGVRKMLVQETGRYDLVRDGFANDWTDMGRANLYINEAQKWLDRRLPHHKSRSKLYKTVAAAESMITFGHARPQDGRDERLLVRATSQSGVPTHAPPSDSLQSTAYSLQPSHSTISNSAVSGVANV